MAPDININKGVAETAPISAFSIIDNSRESLHEELSIRDREPLQLNRTITIFGFQSVVSY